MGKIKSTFLKYLADKIPNLDYKLRQANISSEKERFMLKVIMNTLVFSVLMSVYLFFLLHNKFSPYWLFVLFPVFLFLSYSYFIRLPDIKIIRKRKEIDREIVFAMRFLIIELQSGIPIYTAFLNITKNYRAIGFYTKEILDKINLGTSLELALKETIDTIPSESLQKIFFQILNATETGSDISKALNTTLEQIVQEQYIEVKEYGRKLNPIAMFYMLVAIIFPSLGMTMIVVMSLFIGFRISLPILMILTAVMAFLQFMFLSMIRSQRPAVEL
ncbi:type II secretion system F family protein [Candidatus Woesearchaeota archaeon]|nr:type II secretion system F family protein [Candidatus Woesearchaeota archaeon]